MRWLIVRMRARRIKRIAESHFKITAQDIKLARAVKKCGSEGERTDWQGLKERLKSTRIQRILGWEID